MTHFSSTLGDSIFIVADHHKYEPWVSPAVILSGLLYISHDLESKMEPHERREVFGPLAQPKQFVLCFDGTGNKFAGDESDTNLVKIYRVGTRLSRSNSTRQ